MSSLLCSSNCGSISQPPTNYQDLCAAKARKKYGFKHYVLVQNDQVMTDPSSLVEWQALIDGDSVRLGPAGVVDFGTPSFTTSTDDSACGETEVLETIYTPQFSTYWVDPDNLTHATYFKELVEKHKCQTIFFIDCDDNFIMPDSYVATINAEAGATISGSPGFGFGITQTPHPTRGDGDYEKWITSFEIKLPGSVILRPVAIPGLYQILVDGDQAP